MKTKVTFITLMMIFILGSCFAQETSRKAQRQNAKLERVHQTEILINSREFVFTASRALPLGGGSIDLTTNPNYLKFHPDRIESYLPFFGRAYNVDYGGDAGLKFQGKPKEFKVVNRGKGKGYEINTNVSGKLDNYQINLLVSPEGSATLIILSNNRNSITYFGEIKKMEERNKEHPEDN